MTTPTFPTYMRPLFNGFEIGREDAIRRTSMDGGPPKQVKAKSRVMVTRRLTYAASSASDYNAFITWFNTDIDRGASWFDWVDPLSGSTKTARIVGGKLQEVPRLPTFSHWELTMDIETWE